MKLVNNNISPLPFYDNFSQLNHRKDYAYGNIYPLVIYRNNLLPFQVILPPATKIQVVTLNSFERNPVHIKTSMEENGLKLKNYDGFSILVYPGILPIVEIKHEGQYYLYIGIEIEGKIEYIYSDIFTVSNNVDSYLLLEYRNSYNFELRGGMIDFSDNFKFKVYLPTQVGKPEYSFEEEATERMGYAFVESQVSKKIYKFMFLAPEYLCDALRIVRMCEQKQITSKSQIYDLTTFNMDVDWQEQGDLAAVECEFETDTVIANIGGYTPVLLGGDFNEDFNDDYYDIPSPPVKPYTVQDWVDMGYASIGTYYVSWKDEYIKYIHIKNSSTGNTEGSIPEAIDFDDYINEGYYIIYRGLKCNEQTGLYLMEHTKNVEFEYNNLIFFKEGGYTSNGLFSDINISTDLYIKWKLVGWWNSLQDVFCWTHNNIHLTFTGGGNCSVMQNLFAGFTKKITLSLEDTPIQVPSNGIIYFCDRCFGADLSEFIDKVQFTICSNYTAFAHNTNIDLPVTINIKNTVGKIATAYAKQELKANIHLYVNIENDSFDSPSLEEVYLYLHNGITELNLIGLTSMSQASVLRIIDNAETMTNEMSVTLPSHLKDWWQSSETDSYKSVLVTKNIVFIFNEN